MECELAIVGSGIVGAWTSFLSGAAVPAADTIVLEKGAPSSGATMYSPGHCHPYGDGPRQYALASRSHRFYTSRRLIERDLVIRLPLLGIVSSSLASAVVSGYLDEKPVVFDSYRSECIAASLGLSIGSSQVVHGGTSTYFGKAWKITQYLLSLFRASGGTIWDGCKVAAAEDCGRGIRLITSCGKCIIAKRVVFATGTMLQSRIGSCVPNFSARRKKVCALHLSVQLDSFVYLHDDDSYLMPRKDLGFTIFSFPSDDWDCESTQDNLFISENDISKATRILKRYSPFLSSTIAGGRVSSDCYSPDHNPGAWRRGDADVVWAGLGSGFGFRLAPAVATEALELLFPQAKFAESI